MRIPKHTKRFRRDYAKAKRSGKKMAKLDSVMQTLNDGLFLPPALRDHLLHGEWQNTRDCHIQGDWVLVYELGFDEEGNETITYHATDTHENVFG